MKIKIAYHYNNKPINWFGHPINLILLMTFQDYHKNFSKTYNLLFDILMDNKLYHEFIQNQSYNEFIIFIERTLITLPVIVLIANFIY